jgi:alpha-tubulin suppressor-like RCC1 family protein
MAKRSGWLFGAQLLMLSATSVAAGPPSLGDRPVQVVLGEEHSCALTAAGGVRCWGRNYSGQLGDGTREDRAVAQPVIGLQDVTQLAAFGARTCAARRDGTVWCWGGDRTIPERLPGLRDVAEIQLGALHACARGRDGSVRCWGRNSDGQLGDGTTRPRPRPTRVAGLGLHRAVQLALGTSHSCALLDDTTVRCWGSNEGGQLGDSTVVGRTRATPIPEFSSVVELAASGSATCARLHNGTVRCWGWNPEGQLGDGTQVNHGIPKAVYGLGGVRGIALGSSYGCALLGDRTVRCWGDNALGQLTDERRDRSLVPAPIANFTAALSLGAAGQIHGGHVCAIAASGHVRCWGKNDHGQLGQGNFSEQARPGRVLWPLAHQPPSVARQMDRL